jgi:hypothetical protein
VDSAQPRGAFGLTLGPGLGHDHDSLPVADARWPSWTIGWSPPPSTPTPVAPDGVRIPVTVGGHLDVDFAAREASIRSPARPTEAAVMHPWLSTIAIVAATRRELATFHAGGILLDGRVWAVLGAKLGGKTTTLAWLSQHGGVVTSDDLVVVDGDRCLSGPGCLDLREQAADHLGLGSREVVIADRVRWRAWFAPAPASLPLGGFVLPEWGDEIEVAPVGARERLERLVAQRAALTTHGGERHLLDLCRRPMLRWRRPRDLGALSVAGEALLDAVSRAAASGSDGGPPG